MAPHLENLKQPYPQDISMYGGECRTSPPFTRRMSSISEDSTLDSNFDPVECMLASYQIGRKYSKEDTPIEDIFAGNNLAEMNSHKDRFEFQDFDGEYLNEIPIRYGPPLPTDSFKL